MKILFLCVANSARSQMAEGFAKKILGNDFEIESAGSQPSGRVSPFAIRAMTEVAIDISGQRSKSWKDLPSEFFTGIDYVVTLCAEEVCPTLAVKARKLHWAIPDPAVQGRTDEERFDAFRKSRDEIKRRLEGFKAQVDFGK